MSGFKQFSLPVSAVLRLSLCGLLVSSSAFADPSKPKSVIFVPESSFQMGCSLNDADCESDEGKPGGVAVFVPAFYIDTHEVMVSEYQACMDAGKCSRPKDFARNKYCNLGARGRSEHPINCVDWAEAKAFCKWRGQRLPYEAEWEKAARASSLSRYPWGESVSCKQAILDDGETMGSVAGEGDGCGEDRTWPVGTRAANALGLFDMHGNVGEWTMNWYAKDGLAQYVTGNLTDQKPSPRKVVRGGSWDEMALNLRSSFRNIKAPVSGESVYGSIGFRCVKD
ncbi:formylglycine-generating enzyme family protein [uncultured Shewanella sp.]|uniref:formylglycine-generating enzyme family protein n=1 Tax=uncultured Shewanella sp. TaxID=173975 RepID=UPI002602B41E|nr:formylglycine-generating enzyme family protein [uncultured Shewanella sp.]